MLTLTEDDSVSGAVPMFAKLSQLVTGEAGVRTARLEVDGGEVDIVLKKNPRARRISMRIDRRNRAVNVTLPPRASYQKAREFVEREAAWIGSRIRDLPGGRVVEQGGMFPFRGEATRIEISDSLRGHVRHDIDEDGDPFLVVPGGEDHASRRLVSFLQKEARTVLGEAVPRYAGQLGVTWSSIRISDPVTRWGSCSTRGTLSFSWRLILAPPRVLEYVAAHEVAHRKEMNHSSRFWAHVNDLFPGYRKEQDWLKKEGPALQALQFD